jgi:membrane protein
MKTNIEKLPMIKRLKQLGLLVWNYCNKGVWSDTRSNVIVSLIKTLNLSVRSFLDTGLQSRAAALTYRTILAIIPVLALVFAIARGFGFHKLLQSQIFTYFPEQKESLDIAFGFVESYLSQTSEGLFVGIGIVFLLWTLISLISNIEASFNIVWGIKKGRGLWRKLTDYTAVVLILPIILICAMGLQIFLSNTMQDAIPFEFLSPIYPVLLKIATFVLTWLFFAGMYMLIPNTKVRFKNAFIAGIVSGTAFQIIQWLFLSGQLYVSKYNAIYGSFSLIPLLLMWLYFVWVITLSGAVLCYSSQNIFRFSFINDIKEISPNYRRKISIVTMTLIAKQFEQHRPPLTLSEMSMKYDMPIRLVTDIVNEFVDAGLVSRVVIDGPDDVYGLQPAMDVQKLTLGYLVKTVDCTGASGFVDEFDERFPEVFGIDDKMMEDVFENVKDIRLIDIDIKLEN